MTLDGARARDARRAAATVLGGAVFLAVTNACLVAATRSWPPVAVGGAGLWLLTRGYDAAETLGVGAILALVVGAFVFVARPSRAAATAVGLVAAGLLTQLVLGDYLAIFAQHLKDGRFAGPIRVLWLFAVSGGLFTAPALGASASRSRALSAVAVLGAIVALVVDHLVLPDDYFDIHGLLALGASLLAGAAMAPRLERAAEALARRAAGRAALAALLVVAAYGVLSPPPNAVRFELFRQPCPIAAWTLATALWKMPGTHAPVTVPTSPWLTDRAGAPPVPPTTPPLLPPDAVVVLITLDALRADVVADPAELARFPTLARMKREGVVFTQADSAGAQTETSFATIFSDRYVSELRWDDSGTGWLFHPHPTRDTFPRFPELLRARGVTTSNFAGIGFLGEGYGVARGFTEETRTLYPRSSASGLELIGPLLHRLEAATDAPLFACTHLIDTHAPYGRKKPGESDHERYLGTVASSDKQLGRVLHLLETKFGTRWALFVSADHGEAFGEHGTTEHAKTLYEELLHVPLLAMSPRFAPREVDARVGLVDLAPTFLDLFGVDTPATFEGQSLVPWLAGGAATPTRPLIAEGRLRRALRTKDDFKVIVDPRRKLVEAYDLSKDPGETVNVFDLDAPRADAALAELTRFFEVHAWREPGYRAPYKP